MLVSSAKSQGGASVLSSGRDAPVAGTSAHAAPQGCFGNRKICFWFLFSDCCGPHCAAPALSVLKLLPVVHCACFLSLFSNESCHPVLVLLAAVLVFLSLKVDLCLLLYVLPLAAAARTVPLQLCSS